MVVTQYTTYILSLVKPKSKDSKNKSKDKPKDSPKDKDKPKEVKTVNFQYFLNTIILSKDSRPSSALL